MNEHTHDGCHHLLGSLSDYIDGDLDDALCAEIEQHMAGCTNCQVVVDTLTKTVSLYQMLPEQPLPQDMEARLFRRMDLEEFISS